MRYVPLLLLLACGDGVQQTPPADCDPVENTGCPADEHCRVGVDGATFCLAPQNTTAVCVTGSCPGGQVCLRVEGRLACHALCRPGEVCVNGGDCAYPLGTDFGVCETPCSTDADCGSGSCGFGASLDRLICVGTGEVAAGGECSEARCAAGLLCLARDGVARCEERCEPGAPDACAGAPCNGMVGGFPELGYCLR